MNKLVNKHWLQYVWLDYSGEPRCQSVIADIPSDMRNDNKDSNENTQNKAKELPSAKSFESLLVNADISGYAQRANAVYFASPYRVYRSPSRHYPGLILLCDIVNDANEPVNNATQSRLSLEKRQEESTLACPVRDLQAIEIQQQFYLTTKFIPISFINNPPAKPGPFGSGVGGDLAVGRSSVAQAAYQLSQLGFNVHEVAPQATPSHWGISLQFSESSTNWEQIIDSVVLIRFIVAQCCEEANMTPAFMGKLLKDPWPPSVLKITVKGKAGLSGIDMAKRIQPNHEELMLSLIHI